MHLDLQTRWPMLLPEFKSQKKKEPGDTFSIKVHITNNLIQKSIQTFLKPFTVNATQKKRWGWIRWTVIFPLWRNYQSKLPNHSVGCVKSPKTLKTKSNIKSLSYLHSTENFSKTVSNLPITTLPINLHKQRKLQNEHSHLIMMSAVSDNEERTIIFLKSL